MFSLVSLDTKNLLPYVLVIAGVAFAWWAFKKGNANQQVAADPNATADASSDNQLTQLAILESLLGGGTGATAAAGSPTSQNLGETTTTAATGNTQLSTSQVTYTAPATDSSSNQTAATVNQMASV